MNKNNKIYLIVLIVLVIIFALTKMDNKTEKRINFFEVDSTDIAKIEIFAGEDTIALEKISGEWKLSYPIKSKLNENQLENLFSKVLTVENSKLPISELESSFEEFELTDSLATHIIFLNEKGEELDYSLIGKSDDYNNSPARKNGENKIYRLESNISYMIKPDVNSWRNKVITKVEESDVQNIIISSENNEYMISFKDSTWFYEDKQSAFAVANDNSNLSKLFSGIKVINTSKFIDNEFEKFEEKFTDPYAAMEINLNNGDSVFLKIVMEDDKPILQKNDETLTLYEMRKNWLDRFLLTSKDFK